MNYQNLKINVFCLVIQFSVFWLNSELYTIWIAINIVDTKNHDNKNNNNHHLEV